RRDEVQAQKIIDADVEIDRMEVEIEEDCLKVLALYQPVAVDLRFIVSVLKINNDLERIGDLAVNIAERAIFLAAQPRQYDPLDIPLISEKAQVMLKNSLDALVNADLELAREVCAADDEVDVLNRGMHDKVRAEIRKNIEVLQGASQVLDVSRFLERIADQATNIAEDVIYMVEGQIIRHHHESHQ
ncbi:MAG: phosphate signaling complex protein PhoU, partial [candidate division Zixibacteria bacterium]|nr:phosphate signaling complex protein PhoU [candidate division Zixibacteria bacterium]